MVPRGTPDPDRVNRLEAFCTATDRASLHGLDVWDCRMLAEFVEAEIAESTAAIQRRAEAAEDDCFKLNE